MSDISPEGVRIITLNPLEFGTAVTIVFENPTKTQKKTMHGTFAWQNCLQSIRGPIWRAPGMGVRFAQEAPFAVELLSPNGSRFHLEEAHPDTARRGSVWGTTYSNDVGQKEPTEQQAPAFLRPFRL